MRRILIIILILLAVGGGVWYFYIKPKEQGSSSPVPNILKPFFPTSTSNNNGSFGSGETVNIVPSTGITSGVSAPTAANFKQLTAVPIAGFSIFSTGPTPAVPAKTVKTKVAGKTVTTTTPAVPANPTIDYYLRYVARANGYVYEIKDGGTPLQISNIFIPNVYEAFFADNNNTAILRFLRNDQQTIATYSLPIPPLNPDGTRTQLSGTYLPDNITDMAVSPDQSLIARITNDNSGAIITTSNSVGADIKALARNGFFEWLPSWVGSTVYLQTKAANSADGFLYSIDASTARLQRIVGDVPGLTASVSPSGTYVLYSQSTSTGFITKLFNTKTNVTVPINLAILPEKCAWLKDEDLICAGNASVPSATYPDDWYSGITHFSDQLYQIATKTNTYSILYNDNQESFDMTDLQVDETNNIVYFIDKSTGLLWQFTY